MDGVNDSFVQKIASGGVQSAFRKYATETYANRGGETVNFAMFRVLRRLEKSLGGINPQEAYFMSQQGESKTTIIASWQKRPHRSNNREEKRFSKDGKKGGVERKRNTRGRAWCRPPSP